MEGVRITVTSYAGYKGEEMPRSFTTDGRSIEVEEVARMWTEEDRITRRAKRFFRVKGRDSHRYVLYYDEESMAWYLTGYD
jgi:hypothetical protein